VKTIILIFVIIVSVSVSIGWHIKKIYDVMECSKDNVVIIHKLKK